MKTFFFKVTNFLEGFGTTQPFWGANYLLMKAGNRLLSSKEKN